MKKIVYIFFLMVLPAISLYAETTYTRTTNMDSAEGVLQETISDIKTAQKLMMEGSALVRNKPTRRQIELAIELYSKAGQIFEKVEKVYNMLGSDYVRPEDKEGARQAKQNCISTIEQLKQLLWKQQYVNS